jgi:predicted nucleotidyltransferase
MHNYVPNAVLIGGCAVVHYLSLDSERELTPDMDMMVDDTDSIRELMHSQAITHSELSHDIGLLVQDFNVDLLNAERGNLRLNHMVMTTAIPFTIDGILVKVIAPELLVIMKIELSREKDITDAYELLQSGRTSKDRYDDYVDLLKDDLTEYDTHVSNSLFLR